jgi:hypothetical protein
MSPTPACTPEVREFEMEIEETATDIHFNESNTQQHERRKHTLLRFDNVGLDNEIWYLEREQLWWPRKLFAERKEEAKSMFAPAGGPHFPAHVY